MARIQVLELPLIDESNATDETRLRAPFALVIDQVSAEEIERLRKSEELSGFRKDCHASAVLVYNGTLDVA
ncbi:S-adenosylmethionine synthetase [Streptomyces filamentosus]